MLKGDPHNNNLTKMVAWEQLNIGTTLYELEQFRPALASQLAAMDLLRPMLDLDAKNETARYDTAFAMNEVGKTLLAMGQAGPARAQLTESLGVLSQAGGIADAGITENRMLLGMIYVRLGLTHSLEASRPSATRAERSRACAEAQHWFALGEPIVTEGVTKSVPWRYYARGLPDQMAEQTASCAKVMTVSR
jgi:hypothetical protein